MIEENENINILVNDNSVFRKINIITPLYNLVCTENPYIIVNDSSLLKTIYVKDQNTNENNSNKNINCFIPLFNNLYLDNEKNNVFIKNENQTQTQNILKNTNNGTYVDPIRYFKSNNVLTYDSVSKEITYTELSNFFNIHDIKGLKGDIGPQGLKGDTGEKGIKGDIGPQGLKGDTGEKGIKGDIGLRGLMGEKGDIGPQGLKGDIGPQGLKGDTGEIGPAGAPGDRFSTKSLTPITIIPFNGGFCNFNVEPGLSYISGNSVIVVEYLSDPINSFEGIITYYNSVSGNIYVGNIRNINGVFDGNQHFYNVNLDGMDGPEGPQGPPGVPGPAGPSYTTDYSISNLLSNSQYIINGDIGEITGNIESYDIYQFDTDNATSSISITLPQINTLNNNKRIYTFIDATGNAHINNIKINIQGSDKIVGNTEFSITNNYGSVKTISNTNGLWLTL
jgi:hypothetical protein